MEALVATGGGLRGAYGAGALATLCRELGPEYFGQVSSCSVGTINTAFYVSNQPEIIEEVWHNHVHSRLLVNPFNPLRGKNVLDLEYLINLFQAENTSLDTSRILNSPVRLTYALTDSRTGKVSYHTPESEEEIFSMMKASCSLPFVAPPVLLNGSVYIDGSLSMPVPITEELLESEILVVYNKPVTYSKKRPLPLIRNSSNITYNLISNFKTNALEAEETLRNPKIRVIRPKKPLALKSILDTNRERINHSFNQGIEDAHNYLREL